MKSFRKFYIIILIFFSVGVYAQDPHFSQYFNSPLLLNPASTGSFNGLGRIGVHYRQQWRGVGEPFVTGVLSYDTKILKNKLNELDKLGAGIICMYDKSSAGALKSNYALISTAYNIGLDEDAKNSISIGFQGTLGTRKLDYNKISFFNQFSSDGFNLSLDNGENFSSSTISYLDLNVGGLYKFEDDNKLFYLGASYYHLPRPIQSFNANNEYKLPSRYTMHFGTSLNVGPISSFSANGIYMQQGKVKEIILGLSYSYFIPSQMGTSFTLGLWNRFNESLYPYVEWSQKDFLIGFSYDINTSSLALESNKNYSFEISITYKIKNKKE